MANLILHSRGMSFDSMKNKLCMKKSDLGNFRFYSVISKDYTSYQLEIMTHDRDGIVNTYVDTCVYSSLNGCYKRAKDLCFYSKPTKRALLREINSRFGTDFTGVEIV